MSDALDTVLAFLESDGWPVAVRDDVVATKFEGTAGIWICEARVDAYERFAFYSVVPELVPESRRPAAAEYLTRANAGLVVGNFELDLDSGRARMKTSVDFEGQGLSPALVRNLVYGNVRAMDHFAPGLVAVIEEQVEPAEAIAHLSA